MLFDNGTLFEELEISKEKELCKEYMGKFPVISITPESVNLMSNIATRST